MRKLIAVLLIYSVVCGASSLRAAPPETKIPPDSPVFGVYPIAYRDIIMTFLESRLLDAASAKFEWGEPRQGEILTREKQRVSGYLVEFKVNSRNKFGMYTGKQNYYVVIRNGEILTAGRGSPGQ